MRSRVALVLLAGSMRVGWVLAGLCLVAMACSTKGQVASTGSPSFRTSTLFWGEPGQPAKVADYTGSGPLGAPRPRQRDQEAVLARRAGDACSAALLGLGPEVSGGYLRGVGGQLRSGDA
jgi:hypothetical protein